MKHVGLAALGLLCAGFVGSTLAQPRISASSVQFDSADQRTRLTGYLFTPAGAGPFPAIVLLHGRAGLYSSRPDAPVSPEGLSVRHRHWAQRLADDGYVVLLVDSFAPRGYPAGFGRNSYAQRPAQVSEQTVRPLDALGAAAFLGTRADVRPDRMAVLGWSNGAMAALALATGPGLASGAATSVTARPFRAALALYPGCGVLERAGATPSIPTLLLIAGADEEVSPATCERWARSYGEREPGFIWEVMPGAAHNFDGLALTNRARREDQAAAEVADTRVRSFLARHLVAP